MNENKSFIRKIKKIDKTKEQKDKSLVVLKSQETKK